MKLLHLSTVSILCCLLGLAAVGVMGIQAKSQVQEKQADIRDLMALQSRIGAISAASDSLLLYRADPSLWNAFRSEVASVQQTLANLTEEHPSAQRASRHLDYLVESLESVYAQAPLPGPDTAPSAPLAIPLRSQIIMNRIASYGIALDTALEEVTSQRQTTIAREATRLAAGLAGAASLFGVVCIVALGLLYKRIHGPMRALSGTIQRIESGNTSIRAPVKGGDEFAELASAFNRMLDQQGTLMAKLTGALETRRALIDSLPAHIALLDVQGTIVDVNDQWRCFGSLNDYRDDAFGIGRNYLAVCRAATGEYADDARATMEGLQAVLDGERNSFALEYPCHSPDALRWFRMMANRLAPNRETESPLGAVVMHVDITERKLAERELNRLAYEDPLTGLVNRHGFTETLARRLESREWEPHDLIVLLDIEGQRNVNDAHGYDIGDKLLIHIARRLEQRLAPEAVLGRINGDEFIAFLPDDAGLEMDTRLERLAGCFATPFDIQGVSIEISARFGFTPLGQIRRDPERLLHEVEMALLEARHNGSSDWTRYSLELDREAQRRIQLARDLRQALEDEQFELHYQPKVDLQTGELIACEALLRWIHPERGLQSPAEFIPVAEQSQLIVPIGDWVLQQACRHLREWQDAGLEVVRVSINVSVEQFRLGGFIDKVRDAIAIYAIDPAGLTLEITESVFVGESEMLRQQMNELHAMGVRLSLDDFGTGYSSMLYLQKYPFDEIKIDMGFVRRILDDAYSHKIVSTVLGITEVLGADAVAEGVENMAVRDALIDMGCHIGQGFYYSMPLEVEDFRWLLERRSRLPLVPPRLTMAR